MNTAAAADDAAAAAVASQYHSDKAQRLCALFDIITMTHTDRWIGWRERAVSRKKIRFH